MQKFFGNIALSYLFRNICEENYARENLRLSPNEQFAFEAIIESTYKEYVQKQEGYMNIIRAYMIQLIVQIMRSVKSHLVNDNIIDKSSSMIHSVMNYLQQNYDHSFNLNELALKSFYSKNYLCTLFKETTGLTISQYVQNIRIKEACSLLKDTQDKIVDIASTVGFSDYKAFNICFKKIKGVTPKEYRKR